MRILVLVGPKGSGKTFIGRLIEQQQRQQLQHATFLEIEMVAKEFLANIGGTADSWKDETFRISFFEQVMSKIEELAKTTLSNNEDDILIFETTGAAPETKGFLQNLKKRFGNIHLIRIHASASTCAKRIQHRDSSRQVDVPIEMIRRMHAATDALDWQWDLELTNEGEDGGLSKQDVRKSIAKYLS